MLQLLRTIVDTITMLVNLVGMIFQSLLNFIVNIPTYINFIVSLLVVVPTYAYTYTIAGITITVILWFLNRKTGQTK